MGRDVVNEESPGELRANESLTSVKWGQGLAVVACAAVALPFELQRLAESAESPLIGINVDATPYVVMLMVLPLFWWLRGRVEIDAGWWAGLRGLLGESPTNATPAGRRLAQAFSMGVFVLSMLVSCWIGNHRGEEWPARYADLPPAYHDEYSYLFQAETFLAGRVSFPSHESVPRLFDQMHVLNEGRFASRYFPGAGAWIVPWLALGHPLWGHWIAGGLTACLIFWAGRELHSTGVGMVAGGLTALSPGMGLFSNLLLAHHPTLAGLSLFLYCFLRMMRTGGLASGLLAGCGLAFAMLCRPMTAAGFGLPFGIWLGYRMVQAWRSGDRHWGVRQPLAVGGPLLVGFLILFVYNRAVTGDGFVTPYQLYTDIYTPRHVYGFNNVVRGEQHLGPRVLENYDRWAVNLTPGLAVQNVWTRLLHSGIWTLGLIPLLVAGIVFVSGWRLLDRRWQLVGAAIVALHIVHIPYWYDGIMHWHYVFETGPLWCLVFAAATGILLRAWRVWDRPWMPVWWGGITVVALAVHYTSISPFWFTPRITASVEETAFSRLKYASVRGTLDDLANRTGPLLVLVEHDPDDRHVDYIDNDPALQGKVLMGRYQPDDVSMSEIVQAFPDRAVVLFDVKRGALRPVK